MSTIKQRFETWLKRLIRDEVSQVDTDLRGEREALLSTIRVLDVQVKSLNDVVPRLNEFSYFKENAELRTTNKELTEHIAKVIQSIQKLHPSMKF